MGDELKPEMDIETLMARIRERVAQRNGTAPAPALAGSASRPAASVLEHPDDPTDALAAQADFNRALVASLGSLARCLQDLHANTASIQQQVQSETEQSSEARGRTQEEVARLRMMAEEQAAHHEEVRRRVESALSAVEEPLRTLSARLDALAARVEEVARLVQSAATGLITVEARVRKRVDEAVASVQSDGATRGSRLQEAAAQQVEAQQAAGERIERLAVALTEMHQRIDELAPFKDVEQRLRHELDPLRVGLMRVRRLARRADSGPASGSADGSESGGVESPPVIATGVPHPDGTSTHQAPAGTVSFDYFMFEQRFRGSVSEIKERQRAYLDLFRGRENVVDLGCGRGEFVELLTEHGVPVTGVDRDEDMLDLCRDRGLRVVRADLFAYLESLTDGSLDGVFCAQVVEHMHPEHILRLIDLCGRKLAAGGLMVAETLNTNCPAVIGNFYLDPTHVRPVPAALLGFMFEQCGYVVRSLRFSAALLGTGAPQFLEADWASGPDLPSEIVNYQDYAVIATRP